MFSVVRPSVHASVRNRLRTCPGGSILRPICRRLPVMSSCVSIISNEIS